MTYSPPILKASTLCNALFPGIKLHLVHHESTMHAWCCGCCARFHLDLGIVLSSFAFTIKRKIYFGKDRENGCLSMEFGSLEVTVESLEWRNEDCSRR